MTQWKSIHQFSSVQSLSRVWPFSTPWITARQASLSITNSRSSLKLVSIKSVMPSNHLFLCHRLLLLPPIPPSIRVFSNESTLRMRWAKYWHTFIQKAHVYKIFPFGIFCSLLILRKVSVVTACWPGVTFFYFESILFLLCFRTVFMIDNIFYGIWQNIYSYLLDFYMKNKFNFNEIYSTITYWMTGFCLNEIQ